MQRIMATYLFPVDKEDVGGDLAVDQRSHTKNLITNNQYIIGMPMLY